jgi:hypothetical protein
MSYRSEKVARVPNTPDDTQSFKRLLFNKHKRTLLHLMRMLEAKAERMANQATRPRRRRRGPQSQPRAVNPATEMRKVIMPIMGELMRLAGDPDGAPTEQKPKERRSRREGADSDP